MNAVELKNVTFSYDGIKDVLKNVNFRADYGEVALVAGHSGEGKSTLLSIISGIIPNVDYGDLNGRVLIGGEDMRGKKIGHICRRIGVVLQNADEQIVQKLVEDEIAFGCENLAFAPEKIQKQIEIVCKLMKLDPSWKTRALSGGQKQRLVTASTLAMGQKIIILDEPLANLDREGAATLMETLRSLAKAGYCAIVVEHRLDTVLPYADKVWHIERENVSEVENKRIYLKEQTKKIEDGRRFFEPRKPLLKLQNVAFAIKNKEILKDITFEIPKGGRTVLLGENGCGKTTLLRLIARLYKPTKGTITQYIDEKLKQRPRGGKAWFRKVGVVYQNPDYQLFMPTVRQEIAFGASSPEYAERISELFGIKRLADRHPQSLSEGQKRRVSIAAVAACAPELLLLDEPTVGQDYAGLCELVDILNKLHEETGNTMITVTHDVRCAEALCDRAVWIENGIAAKQGGKELAREYFFGQTQAD
jgi:ATPase components of various ABC-type transport systems, contain duplicated ATPase